MVSHMKTTIEISDPLMGEARALAAERDQTVREIVEEGLRMVIEAKRHQKKFRVPDHSVSGKGLQPGLSYDDWGSVLELAYGSRK
jgi:hypothetical protein